MKLFQSLQKTIREGISIQICTFMEGILVQGDFLFELGSLAHVKNSTLGIGC